MIAGFFRILLEPFAGRPPILAEAAWGILTGALLFFVFRKFTNATAVNHWKRQRSGQMLSLYLFGDDPALSLRSLGAIAQANAALLWHALPPLLIVAPFVALIAVNLNQFFTQTPLPAGAATVFTVRMTQPCEPSLQAPNWIHVDSPPVHIPATGEVSWRIRATEPRRGVIEIACGTEHVAKEIDARHAPRYVANARERDWAAWLLDPAENRLPDGPIDRIALSESLAEPWTLWFFGIASFTAWLLSRTSTIPHRLRSGNAGGLCRRFF